MQGTQTTEGTSKKTDSEKAEIREVSKGRVSQLEWICPPACLSLEGELG